MNTKMMLDVGMSALFFAPLLVALSFFLIVGVLVLFEGAVAFAAKTAKETEAVATPATGTGPIVAGLMDAVSAENRNQEAAPTAAKAAAE